MSNSHDKSEPSTEGKSIPAPLNAKGNFERDSHLTAREIIAWADVQIAAGKLSKEAGDAVKGIQFCLAQIDNAHRHRKQPHHVTLDILKEQMAKLEAANAR